MRSSTVWLNSAAVLLLLQLGGVAFGATTTCNTIQSGTITDVSGNVITPGFDRWGYNYQAHLYLGLYANFTRPAIPYTEASCGSAGYGELGCSELQMKWNDNWLSNQDCNNDGKLDRPTSYVGSGAWLTNHVVGTYALGEDLIHWTDFVKIVAAPSLAYHCPEQTCPTYDALLGFAYYGDGIYYTNNTATKTEIGPGLWGDFAVIQEVWNDPGMNLHGILFNSPVSPGLGYWGIKP